MRRGCIFFVNRTDNLMEMQLLSKLFIFKFIEIFIVSGKSQWFKEEWGREEFGESSDYNSNHNLELRVLITTLRMSKKRFV